MSLASRRLLFAPPLYALGLLTLTWNPANMGLLGQVRIAVSVTGFIAVGVAIYLVKSERTVSSDHQSSTGIVGVAIGIGLTILAIAADEVIYVLCLVGSGLFLGMFMAGAWQKLRSG